MYAVASGLYSYTVLFILARFAGNVFRNFNPDWSFIPEIAVAALIFRSRISFRGETSCNSYTCRRKIELQWLTSHRLRWAAAGIVGLLSLPLWRESISARFVLEASDRAVIRAQVAGTPSRRCTQEKVRLSTLEFLVQLPRERSPLESKEARNEADYQVAAAALNSAELHYAGTGAALQKRDQLCTTKSPSRLRSGRLWN